jgi:hypothetical protein
MNAIWIFKSYFYQIEPSRLRLTLVVRQACELDDEIGFYHHENFYVLLVRFVRPVQD